MARIAVIGAGYWGRNLVRNFYELGVLDSVADIDDAARQVIENQYPRIKLYKSYDAIFSDPEIDGVVIATPAVAHGVLTHKALSSGKHVFVEKPLCLDVQEAVQLSDLADNKGLILMVGHLLLYHPAFIELLRIVRTNHLGKLRYIHSNRLSLGKIRREENALWSFAPHDISMILQLTGQMPERVMASGAQYLTDGVADTTLSHFVFSNNLQAHVYVSWLHPFKEQKLVVVGEKAMVVFDDTKCLEEKLLLYRHEIGWNGEIPIISKVDPQPIIFSDSEPLRNECNSFLKAIKGQASPPSDASEGIQVLRILEACQTSILTGEPVYVSAP